MQFKFVAQDSFTREDDERFRNVDASGRQKKRRERGEEGKKKKNGGMPLFLNCTSTNRIIIFFITFMATIPPLAFRFSAFHKVLHFR